MTVNVAAMFDADAFSQWLGIELVSCSPGRCALRMQVRDDMVNGFGVAHGGIAFSLADSAMAFACNAGKQVTVAIDNAISYPAPVRVGDEITATATEESATGRLAFYRVVVHRGDDVVALFRGTVYRTKTLHSTETSS